MEKAKCSYCGTELELEKLELEHIFPKCLGGTDNVENLTLACRNCNTRKSKKTVEVFLKEIGVEGFEKTADVTIKAVMEKRISGRFHYEVFKCARIEPELIDWLRLEKEKYVSWNMFFRELKKRYEKLIE